MRFPVLLLCSVVALFPKQVHSASDEFEKAMQFVRDGAPGLAVNEFTRLAHAGDKVAQINLAVLLARGVGTPQNEADAYYWAWRARISGELRKAPDVVGFLSERLDDKTRNRIAERLVDDYQDLADTGSPDGFLGASVVLMEVSKPAQPKEALVWAIMATATNPTSKTQQVRDAIAERLSERDRLEAQSRARKRFGDWCAKVPSRISGAFCTSHSS